MERGVEKKKVDAAKFRYRVTINTPAHIMSPTRLRGFSLPPAPAFQTLIVSISPRPGENN